METPAPHYPKNHKSHDSRPVHRACIMDVKISNLVGIYLLGQHVRGGEGGVHAPTQASWR